MPSNIIVENPYPHQEADNVLNQAFGDGRLERSIYQLRHGLPMVDLCRGMMVDGRLAALIRYWQITTDAPALQGQKWLLLGPLAVIPDKKNKGYGTALINASLADAYKKQYHGIFVSGEKDYYQKFGFRPVKITAPQNTSPNQWLMLNLRETPDGESAMPEDSFSLMPYQ